MSTPELKRGIFGYTGRSVRLILADREQMFVRVSADAKTAEERAAALQSAVESAERELEKNARELRAGMNEIDALRGELEDVRPDLEEVRQQLESSRRELEETREAARRGEQIAAELRVVRQLHEAEADRARAAVERAAALEADLAATREALAEHESGAGPTGSGVSTSREISFLLDSTQEAIARIIDDAERRAGDKLRAAERARERIEEDAQCLRTWAGVVAPLVGEFRVAIDSTRTRAVDLRDGVDELLKPMSDAVDAMSRQLDELGRVADRPMEGTITEIHDEAPVHLIELPEEMNPSESTGPGSHTDHGAGW